MPTPSIGALLLQLQKAHRQNMAGQLSALNLYPGQDGLLYHLSQNDGLTMSQLVAKMQIKHPTLFTMVNRMEAGGLIKKEKNSTDQRSSRIFLTEKGNTVLKELSQLWRDREQTLWKDFSEEEKTNTTQLISKLIHNLNHE